ncbi:MAG TPA: Na(+)-translocating NADH-quinone reductase subunit A [Flavobacteriaceae bacterium]|nr:Na(+)-translocating NADH-quinone reductase subunit A [Flavobacteriaceae bacterium]
MSKDIIVKKGLNINLVGDAIKTLDISKSSKYYSVYPDDFHGVYPKLTIKADEKVKAGDVLFYDKNNEKVKFVSPVSGKINEIQRGERRKVISIKIEADKEIEYKNLGKLDVKDDKNKIIDYLLNAGLWPFIKQRPYDVIADPNMSPKSIFISGFSSAPLSADLDYISKGSEEKIQIAIDLLSKLTEGEIHMSVRKNSDSILSDLKNITIHNVSGPHPAGNVGTLINKVSPVNKGEVVWTISLQDLILIGSVVESGKFSAERIIALVGSSIDNPRYIKTLIGSGMSTILDKGIQDGNRIISGNVLTGKQTSIKGHLDYYSNTITVIPEGNDYDLFGWTRPIFDKISTSRALTFSWLMPNKKFDLNTNTNGEHRAFVVTGSYEEVFPLDIFPMRILKACMYKDLDEMEALGMYEVAPEDFALTEFVCVSKQPHQDIIRKGLDLMKKELG